jgi:hypothetical protein
MCNYVMLLVNDGEFLPGGQAGPAPLRSDPLRKPAGSAVLLGSAGLDRYSHPQGGVGLTS